MKQEISERGQRTRRGRSEDEDEADEMRFSINLVLLGSPGEAKTSLITVIYGYPDNAIR